MKTLIHKFSVVTAVSVTIFLSSFSQGFAEDIEIYNRQQTVPNIMFVVDTSESMLATVSGKTRMQHVKDALAAVLTDSYDTLNVGMMNLGYWDGSGPDFPVVDINAKAQTIEPTIGDANESVGEFLTRLSGAYTPKGDTPTVGHLLEAGLYFRGDELYRGNQRPGPLVDALSYYANDQINPQDPSVYPETGPAPQKQTYHRNAANPATYTGGGYDPTILVSGDSCWKDAYGAGSPPTWLQCVDADTFQPFPHGVAQGCNNVAPRPESTAPGCPVAETRECLVWADPLLPQTDPPNECATWGPYSCPVNLVDIVTPARQGYIRCNHKAYGAMTGTPVYTSPINTACSANYIVMLTDGAPSRSGEKWRASTLVHGDSDWASNCMDLSTQGISAQAVLEHGVCGPDVAKFLAENDQSTSVSGNQFINTHTIGISLPAGSDTRTYLELLASEGGGQYIDAQDPATLITTLQSLVTSFVEKPRVISRIATSPDLTNLGSNRPEVYMPLFADNPNEPRWQGNLKGYLIDANGQLVDTSGDLTATPPVLPKPVFIGGDFNTQASSFWSSGDGGNIDQGGLVSILPDPGSRNLLTDDGTLLALNDANFDDSDIGLFGLTSSGNAVTDNATVDNLINWVRGADVYDEDGDSTTTKRNFVGDALHSNPVVASYDESGNDGIVDRVVTYFMTNEGLIHAIDDGYSVNRSNNNATELFAYMPRDLLGNIEDLKNNNVGNDLLGISGSSAKIYGLDGPLVLYQDGGVRNVTGNKYLFFGMRRGGMNYYSLDVTDPDNPSLMWTIKGGTGDFKELGQTWSMPIVTKADVGGTIKDVLVFGGGYDKDQDNTTAWTADDQGRAIYIVDLETGAKIWSAGPSSSADAHDLTLNIENAIAGDVTVIDFDSDGTNIGDRIYFADVGGHIYRIDIEGDLTDSSKTSGYLFADLHDNTTANNRRFFSRPVASTTKDGKLALSIGSGNRSHPLQGVDEDSVTDRFYTLFDPHADKSDIPSSFSAFTDASLQNLTGFSAGFDTSGLAGGWRVDLQTDEKIFTEPKILLGEVYFTTYVPPSNTCSNIPDGANLYVLNLDGEPTRDLDATPDGINDAFVAIYTQGIVGGSSVVYSPTGRVDLVYAPNSRAVRETDSLEDKSWTNSPPPPPVVTP